MPLPLPARPLNFTLLAVDGSQIVPNRHRALQFGLINIGIFKVHFNSGEPPMIDLISELLISISFLLTGSISEDEVGLQRDLRERVLIRDSITSEDPRPFLTLTDGPLDFSIAVASRAKPLRRPAPSGNLIKLNARAF